MIISDLQHLEVVAEETSIVGGTYYDCGCDYQEYIDQVSVANADAKSAAFGDIAVANTKTETLAAPGVAVSSSGSSAFAANKRKKH